MAPPKIQYVKGDATSPIGEGNKIICHVCNDIGAWGAGFVLAISKKWKKPEEHYRNWASHKTGWKLGAVQYVAVQSNIEIANMICQRDIRWHNGVPPIRYDAIREALIEVGTYARYTSKSVHMPRIGCGLAGGKWEEIEKIITETLYNVDVVVYDFE